MVVEYRYLLIGGGMASDSAARGIRQFDPDGSIGMISSEPDPPYNRPPLSKGLWKRLSLNRIWRGTEKLDVHLHLGRAAVQLDPDRQLVTDDQGDVYHYEKLLLATGGSPVRLPFGGDQVIYFRYLEDYRRLRRLAETKSRFVVIGGGFIGSEIAAALRMQGKDVTMLFLDKGIGSRLFPPDLSNYLNEYYRDKGVALLPGRGVDGIEARGEETVVLSGDEEIAADVIVAGLGIRPNLQLAQQAGLKIDNGIVVDSRLRSSEDCIYAAGDVISFYNSALGKYMRVEHEDHANISGLLAGQSMAGVEVNYDYLPSAYSDLFDLGYESVGELNPSYEIIEDWIEPFQKGVIYYLKDGHARGVLLWNIWGHVPAARELITSSGPFRKLEI